MADGLVPASAVRRLLADEMWESAELLSGLLVAAADESTMSEALVLHGDALSGSGQHRRALEHYRSAQARAPWQPAVKLREARCHVALSESQLAIAALESVPSGARTAAALLLLGRLYVAPALVPQLLPRYSHYDSYQLTRLSQVPHDRAQVQVPVGVQGGAQARGTPLRNRYDPLSLPLPLLPSPSPSRPCSRSSSWA